MSWRHLEDRYWSSHGKTESELAASKAARERFKTNKVRWCLRRVGVKIRFEMADTPGTTQTKKPRPVKYWNDLTKKLQDVPLSAEDQEALDALKNAVDRTIHNIASGSQPTTYDELGPKS
jgi:hypothetical protein